jgi:hypothetical protein
LPLKVYLFVAQSRSEGPTSPAVTRAEAQAGAAVAGTNFQGAAVSLQAWYAENATYAGATLPPGSGVVLVRADASAYCLQTVAGSAVECQTRDAGCGWFISPGIPFQKLGQRRFCRNGDRLAIRSFQILDVVR